MGGVYTFLKAVAQKEQFSFDDLKISIGFILVLMQCNR